MWQLPYGGADKTVDVHLSWLRRKLGESAAEPRLLQTVRGVGVRLAEPEPVRRQITLLVAATTSVVLLAFLLPAASLVARVAEARALDTARAQLQFLIPSVGLDQRDAGGGEPDRHRRATCAVGVRWTDGQWLGDRAAGATAVRRRARRLPRRRCRHAPGAAGPAGATGRRRSSRSSSPPSMLRAGVARTWLVLAGLGVVLLVLALLVADRLARSLTRPVTDLAATAHRLGSGDLTARATPAGPRGGARGRRRRSTGWPAGSASCSTAEREGAADLAHRLRTPLTALRLDAESLPPGRPGPAAGRRRRR